MFAQMLFSEALLSFSLEIWLELCELSYGLEEERSRTKTQRTKVVGLKIPGKIFL